MVENTIYQIIGRVLTKAKKPGDDDKLSVWLEESEENQLIFQELSDNWRNNQETGFKVIGSEEVKENLLKKIRKDTHKTPSGSGTIFRHNWLKVAAAILIIISFSLIVNFLVDKSETHTEVAEVKMSQRENASGRRSIIHLKDGTIIHLNAESSLQYPEMFSDTSRIIYLVGEAYFNVAHDPNKPFSVICGDLSVTALGTSFNINANGVETIDVSLVTGSVKVANVMENSLDTGKNTILVPGQQLSYNLKDKTFGTKRSFDETRILGWKEGVLDFEGADIHTLVRQLERWYGVDIEISSNNPSNTTMQYTGKFKNENLQNVLESIGFVQQFKYEIKDNKVTLFFNN